MFKKYKQILAHRGYWLNQSEQNKEVAFVRALKSGFGIETDIRDLNGEIVVSHDLPRIDQDGLMTLEDLLYLYESIGNKLPLALNIKADGMQEKITEKINSIESENVFLFDMSIPDLLVTRNKGLNFLTRYSDLEHSLELLSDSCGVWVDELLEEWVTESFFDLKGLGNKALFFVSPELHRRDYRGRWGDMSGWNVVRSRNVYLCTDMPTKAVNCFGLVND